MNDINSQQMRVSQNYFSALARGGLAAAISNSANNSQSPKGRQGSFGKTSNNNQFQIQPQEFNQIQNEYRQFLGENINLNNMQQNQNKFNYNKSHENSSGKLNNENQNKVYGDINGQQLQKVNKQLFTVESNRENNALLQQQILNQKRLQSLMSGNDLQPLEEEISKEEDESIIMKAEIEQQNQKSQLSTNPNSARQTFSTSNSNRNTGGSSRHRKKSSNKSNPYFPQAQVNHNSQNKKLIPKCSQSQEQLNNRKPSTDNLRQLSHEQLDHIGLMSNGTSTQSLLKGSTLKSCSSYVSGDFNYNSQMEEALMLESIKLSEIENQTAPKIFEPQVQQSQESLSQKFYVQQVQNSSSSDSQNTSKDLTINQNIQQNTLDYNQIQKEKARLIIEQLKAQKANKQSNHSHTSSQGKVEKRLFDYQKKLDEKIEHQRKLKEQQELQSLRPVPQISGKSNDILMRKSLMISNTSINPQNITQQFSPRNENVSPGRQHLQQPQGNNMFAQPLDKTGYSSQQLMFQNYQVEQKAYYEELKRKEDERLRMIQEKEMKGFTGKPQINKKSQMIKRKVDDLIEWKDIQEKKRQEELQKKVQLECEEIQQMQSHRVVNKNSEKIVETRFRGQRSNEKVEDRLMRDASIRRKKFEKQTQQKQIFYISDLDEKKSKKVGNIFRGRSRSQNNKVDSQKQSRNQTPTNISQNIQNGANVISKPTTNQQFRFDQRIFSQSVDCPNNYYGQTSPNQSNNYMAMQNSNNLQSPYEQSNKSTYSSNLQNLQNSQFINPQSEFSQMQSNQYPQNYNNQSMPIYSQQMQQIGGGSFDLNQFHFNNPSINAFSPQRLYSQQIYSQNQKHTYPLQNMNHNNPMFYLQNDKANHTQPMQQVSYIDNSLAFQSAQLNSNIMSNQNNNSQMIQMTSQLQDFSGMTPSQGSFLVQNNLQNTLAQNVNEKFQLNNQQLQKQNKDIKHVASIQPYIQKNNQNDLNKQPQQKQQQKKQAGYISLFDKVKRMNDSQNSDLESCNSQQSQQSLPIVSAQMPQMFNQLMSPKQETQSNTSQHSQNQKQVNDFNNQVYQNIQHDSQKFNEIPVYNNQFNQQQVQSQSSQPNISTINYIDPSSLITYPGMITQDNSHNMTIQAPIPDNIHQQLQQYAIPQNHYYTNQSNYYNGQNMLIQQNGSSQISQYMQGIPVQMTTQDHIIHKILDNSFIPSGNVNQNRRTSSRGTNDHEGTLGYSQTQQWQQQLTQRPDQFNEDLHDVFAEGCNDNINNDIQSQDQYYSQQPHSNGHNNNYNTIRSRFTNDNGQILDTDFIITNTSRDSDQQAIKNLTQVLNQEIQQHKDKPKNLRSQSETGRSLGSKKGSISPSKRNGSISSVNNLKGLSFMDRNQQWLENKKYRLERAKQEKDQQEEQQCPFKPKIQIQQINTEKAQMTNQVGPQTTRNKSSNRGSSLSLERVKNFASTQRFTEGNEIQQNKDINTLSSPHDQIIIEQEQNINELSSQPSAIRKVENYDDMSTSMKQQELLHSDTRKSSLKKGSSKPANFNYYNLQNNQVSSIDKKHQQLVYDYQRSQNLQQSDNDMDISGQCDITNLSPDPQIRGSKPDVDYTKLDDSNFETSFQSSNGYHAQQIKTINANQVGLKQQIINMPTKRQIQF